MLLRDMGATILRVERPGGNGWPNPVVDRGRSVLELDLRSAAGKEQCLKLTDNADVLIEGFRPGVMERLGLGPEVLCERNSRLIYGRMTGWGQDRSEEHTSELQSLMRISYAVFCLKKQKQPLKN